ncbi:MAG: hypothetical protein H6832_01090 [Planctomycetes bacterium]|nr:hypothetical protein [Planctomycetota bacterium]MCB9916979.1 hypothetical protein [Planctomycetota bacterium]
MPVQDRSGTERLSVIVPLKESLPAEFDVSRLLGGAAVDEIIFAADCSVPGHELQRLVRLGATAMQSDACRGTRLRDAACASCGDAFVFVHADTRLQVGGLGELRRRLAARARWGAFRLAFEEDGRRCLSPIAGGANLRSRLFRLPYGDQGQWCTREAYEAVDGHPPWTFLDDLELSRRLRRLSRPAILRSRAITSARRYRERGVLTTLATNTKILARFAMGVRPDELANEYRRPNSRHRPESRTPH